MSSLHALQQKMLQAVLAGDRACLPELRGDGRASARTRLAVYQAGYRIRLRDALATEFPGLALMAGRRFNTLLEGYVDAHPSGHYNIRWHGAGMAAFLEYGLPWRGRPELADMASLDWAISTVFDASDEARVDPADLAGVPGDAWGSLRLHPQACLQRLAVRHNVEAFRGAADRGESRPRLRRCGEEHHVLVWRQGLTVRYRQLETDERAVLIGAINGEPFAALCERLAGYHDAASATPRMAGLLHQWLASGLIAGWSLH